MDHKLGVLSIHPCIKLTFLRPTGAVLFQELEVYVEQIQKVVEEEVLVDVRLDVVWQLVHKSLILFGLDGIILVVLPIVFKVYLKPFGHLVGQWTVLVEMGEESQPL